MVQRLAELGRSWQLYYACRSRADMAFLSHSQRWLRHIHFDEESRGRFSMLPAIVASVPKAPISIAAARRRCCKRSRRNGDRPREQNHIEYFTPKQEPQNRGFVVELARSGGNSSFPRARASCGAADAGVDVDYSCELGICGPASSG
jgi:vanillate O-demethylase ferredoxin subunit